nr:MerR family DNA-binding protein [Martelella sp.]
MSIATTILPISTGSRARQAQQLGLALKEIGPLLDVHDTRDFTEAETVTFLEERLAVVKGRIVELRHMEAFIEEKLSRHHALAEREKERAPQEQ